MRDPLWRAAIALLVFLGGCACEAPEAFCGPERCATGCCDSMGVCVDGQTTLTCGQCGAACATCQAGDECVQAACVPALVVPGDAGQPLADAGAVDSGIQDSGVRDAGTPDAGIPDAGHPLPDAGTPDAGRPVPDAGLYDAGLPPQADGGLFCVASTSISLSYDVAPVTVSGTLTINGQPLPAGTRGSVEFIDREWGMVLPATLATSGPATFSAQLLRGTYDVRYHSGSQPGLPSGWGKLASGLVVSASSTQAWNLDTVVVSGTVTIDGVAPPEVGQYDDRGLITFRDAAGLTSVSFHLARTGAPTYSGPLFAGTLDVTFASTVPQSTKAVFAKAVPFTTTTTRVDDLPFTTLTATVTLDGQSVNWLNLALVSLEFVDIETGENRYANVSASSPSTFTLVAPRRTYDVFLVTNAQPAPPAPAGARSLLARNVTVGATANFAWQLRGYDLTTTLTLDGLTFPDRGGSERGSISFHDRVGSQETTVPLPLTGPATVTAHLAEGTYDVIYRHANGSFTGVPDLDRVVIARGVGLSANTVLPLRLDTTSLDVSFSIDGVLRNGIAWYDSIELTNAWAGRSGQLFPLGLAARMPVLVYKNMPLDVGAYAFDTGPAAASGGVTVLRGASFTAPGTLALNATTVSASGTVTVNGQPVTDGGTNDRGLLEVVNYVSGNPDRFTIGAGGPVSFPPKRIFGGPVDIAISPPSAAPFNLTGGQSRYLKRACMASECRTTSTNLTGTWLMHGPGVYDQSHRFHLVETATGITGEVVEPSAYYAIERSTRTGNTIRWTTSAYNPAIYTVELESPCRMTGTMEVPGYGTYPFTAIR